MLHENFKISQEFLDFRGFEFEDVIAAGGPFFVIEVTGRFVEEGYFLF